MKWLDVELAGPAPNRQGIHARIFATAGGVTQMRELRCASNYVSQDPAVAHFGLDRMTDDYLAAYDAVVTGGGPRVQ